MLFYIEYAMLFVNTVNMKIKAYNALNAMFVNTVNTGVCGFYTTLYKVASRPCQEGRLFEKPSVLWV